jgi:para-aminobenzoate synthetase
LQPPEPWQFYSTLRSINPAPYSAWLSIAASAAAPAVTVCCSSPERFLSCGRGGVLEAKPIKGTVRRYNNDAVADLVAAAALLGSEKERAENLMIVDLLRNDLGRCVTYQILVAWLVSWAALQQVVWQSMLFLGGFGTGIIRLCPASSTWRATSS